MQEERGAGHSPSIISQAISSYHLGLWALGAQQSGDTSQQE